MKPRIKFICGKWMVINANTSANIVSTFRFILADVFCIKLNNKNIAANPLQTKNKGVY